MRVVIFRCEETYKAHMETTKAKLREELKTEASDELDGLNTKYEKQIKELT